MNKILYATVDAKIPSNDSLINDLKRMQRNQILITPSLPLPRSYETKFHKVVYEIPEWKNHQDISFEYATDMRAQQVLDDLDNHDLPLVVMWSGGIDSTVVLASLLKNSSLSQQKRIIVSMTNASYAENPYFFKNIINKYGISTVDTNQHQFDYTNAKIVHGDPADALWLGGIILNLSFDNPSAHKEKLANKGEQIIVDYLSTLSDYVYARWLYDYGNSTAKLAGFELRTVSDFFWWLIFNFNFSPMCLKHVDEVKSSNLIDYNMFQKNFIQWFSTDIYQIWSIQAQYNQTKFDGTIRSYKMEAKEYIYDLDRNQWYRDYKTKIHSRYRNIQNSVKSLILYENGEFEL